MKKIPLRIDDEGKYKSDEHPILSGFLNISTSIGGKIIQEEEAECPYCSFKEEGTNRKKVKEAMVEHLIDKHHDDLTKEDFFVHEFVKCPSCGAKIELGFSFCPNCGTDILEQYARNVASKHLK